MKRLQLIIFLCIVFAGCSPTTTLLKQRRYPELIDATIGKLNTNANDRKARQIFQKAYGEATAYFQEEIGKLMAENDSMKWPKIVEAMQDVNTLAAKINNNAVAKELISEPKIYTSELAEAQQKATDVLVEKGKALLNAGGKENAAKAFLLFKTAAAMSTESKDIQELMNRSQKAATYNIVIDPLSVGFNTLKVATDQVDKEFYYWTQRDVAKRLFVRYYSAPEAYRLNIEPDYAVQINVLDYRVEKMTGTAGSGLSNLAAFGTLQLKLISNKNDEVVYRKNIPCQYESATKSTITVNTIDLQRVIDPDIQTFFDYMILSSFQQLTDEIDGYFSTLAEQ